MLRRATQGQGMIVRTVMRGSLIPDKPPHVHYETRDPKEWDGLGGGKGFKGLMDETPEVYSTDWTMAPDSDTFYPPQKGLFHFAVAAVALGGLGLLARLVNHPSVPLRQNPAIGRDDARTLVL